MPNANEQDLWGVVTTAGNGPVATDSEALIGTVVGSFPTATDGSQIGQVEFNVYDTAARNWLTVTTTGSAAQVGFFGVTPASQQTGGAKTAGSSYTSNEQAMIQAAYTCLRTFGFLT